MIRRPRRRWIPIALAGVVVVAAAVTAAVLAVPAHHDRPAAAVSPLFSRVAAFTAPRTPGHWQDVSSVAFSPDGKVLAAAGGTGQSILYLLDTATGKQVVKLTGHVKVPITAMAYSPDGRLLAVDDLTGVVYLWNTATRQANFTFGGPGNPNGAAAVAFSPNSRTLATLQTSGARNEVYLYSMTTVKIPAILANPGGSAVTSVSFSPDGKMLATSDTNGSAYLWRVR